VERIRIADIVQELARLEGNGKFFVILTIKSYPILKGSLDSTHVNLHRGRSRLERPVSGQVESGKHLYVRLISD
jgi:hypothetical protein